MRLPATVIFDLDGTLVDSAPDLTHALNHTLAGLDLPPVALEDVRHMVGRGARVLIERGAAAAGATLDEAQHDDAFNRFIAYYAQHIADETVAFPHVREVLDHLRDRGVIMGVCTNKPQRLTDAVLEALELDVYFRSVLGADAVPERKPHPGHLIETIVRAGGDPAASVLVGDSPTDVSTARAATIPVIAVSFGYSDVAPEALAADLLIDSFRDLPEALSSLVADD